MKNITLQDLTTTDELKKLLKFPHLISLQVKSYSDLTVKDFSDLSGSGIYSSMAIVAVFEIINRRYEGVLLGTWKAL